MGRGANARAIERLIRDGLANGVAVRQIAEQIADLPPDPVWGKATSSPTRVAILGLLREGPLSPARAAERLNGPRLGSLAYHFRTLERLAIIEVDHQVQRRGAVERFYRLAAD